MLKTLLAVSIYIIRRWGIYIVLITGTVFLLLLVHRKIYEHFTYDIRYSIDLDKFEIGHQPDWLIDNELQKSIKGSLHLTLKTHIFDEALIARLVTHYQSSPWVARVERIEKRLPNDLQIRLELRKPYVAVKLDKGFRKSVYYLVDKEIVRLPGEYRNLPTMPLALPVVVGIRGAPPIAGEKWPDKGLLSAVAVASIIEKHQLMPSLHLSRIDVQNIGGRIRPLESEIVLWARNNVPIQWGRPPDATQFGEPSIEDKIRNLKLVLEICPELKGIRYIKIQFDQPYIALER